jgi:tripartite-type tricarboxylate transporter receptor subunit TctC
MCGLVFAGFPDRPVKIVVPYSAGSGMDTLARTMGRELEKRWAQPVVVENRTGAAGNIGTAVVARAKPDGYTLLLQIDTLVINPSIYRDVGWDPLKDFTPILQAARGNPIALTAAPTAKVDSVKDLLEIARVKPDSLTYASPGVGTPQHLAMEMLKQRTGLRILHVPFRSTPEAIAQMIAGEIQLMFMPIQVALPQMKAGKLKILAVDGRIRFTSAPEVPTFGEAGLADFDVAPWYGVLGPASMPNDVADALTKAMTEVLEQATVKESLLASGLRVATTSAQDFKSVMQRDRAKWEKLVRDLKLSID